MSSNEPKYTVAYKSLKFYQDHFLSSSNLINVLKENRNFYAGHQYQDSVSNMPKPTFNIVREAVEKKTAKILGTEAHISLVADTSDEDLNELDNFYEYQMNEIDDKYITSSVCKKGMIDGVGCSITSYDEDTFGSRGLFRGFLKRQVIDFENTFWSNPYTEDPQDQEYCGYYFYLSIKACNDLLENKEKSNLIVPDDYFLNQEMYDKMDGDNLSTENVLVVCRFFRIDDQVYFELATKYCDLYENPHALNPKINEKNIIKVRNNYEKQIDNNEKSENGRKFVDYDMQSEKQVLFTKAKELSQGDYDKSKEKFYRYPINLFRPYPISNSILGESDVSLLVANQKIINYVALLIILIMQGHAMPKYLAKEGALNGQTIDNDPLQVITDYSDFTNSWGISRLGTGDAVNSNLIGICERFIGLTRNINGFDDLQSNNGDTSGFAYQQMVKQSNLTLEQPQRELWRYLKNNARTDLLYFKFYIDKAKYYKSRNDSDVDLNENYRMMSQDLIDNGKTDIAKGMKLPVTSKMQIKTVTSELFDKDFNISVEVEQGIAGSELTESQHFNQIWQYISSGNLDADKIKVLVMNDPSFSQKTKQKVKESLDSLEVSQLSVKNQQIQELQNAISEMSQKMKSAVNTIDLLNKKDQARQKAVQTQDKMNQSILQNATNNNALSESEVKSNNAKGISGTSFDTAQ